MWDDTDNDNDTIITHKYSDITHKYSNENVICWPGAQQCPRSRNPVIQRPTQGDYIVFKLVLCL